ncbi:MAG: hypothetical protein R3304_01120 [Longimicrobiales bacterium]|nr:hypothetical protein [Longimicrobiales bacterium]
MKILLQRRGFVRHPKRARSLLGAGFGVRPSRPFATLMVATLFTSCQEVASPGDATLWSAPQEPGRREVLTPEWRESWSVGGQADALLASPRHLTSLDTLVVWWDDYDHALLAVGGEDGVLRWRFGREGQGPGEFLDVGDVAVDAAGTLIVLDSDLGRITRLGPTGAVVRQIRLPEGYWRSVAPLPDGSFVLAGVDAARPFVQVDPKGRVLDRFGAPWAGFAGLSLIQRQGSVISAPDGRWAYAFLIGNGWLPFRGISPVDPPGQAIEHTSFPELIVVGSRRERITKLVSRPSCSTCSGWLRGDTLQVLFGGDSEHAHRVVDRYLWTGGRYLSSLRLPVEAVEAVGVAGRMVLLERALEPRLVAYAPVSTPSASPPP